MVEHLLKLLLYAFAVIYDDEITKLGYRVKLDLKDNFCKILIIEEIFAST